MTKKEKFIKMIQTEIFDRTDVLCETYKDDWSDIISFWDELKNQNNKTSTTDGVITANGARILAWMQSHYDEQNNIFTSKVIAEGLEIGGRRVAGALRKLIADKFVEKLEGTSPIRYAVTATGKEYPLDNDINF